MSASGSRCDTDSVTGRGLAVCLWIGAVLGACAGSKPQQGPGEPYAQAAPPARLPVAAASTPPAPASAAPAASTQVAAPLNVLHHASLVPLQIIPGNPPLLVGDRQVYEWHSHGVVAKPRLLEEVFSGLDLEGQTGGLDWLQGKYPNDLYAQVNRARAGEPTVRRRFLKWSLNRWQKQAGPLADSRGSVVVLTPERGMLAVGCVSERCFFQPVSGKPLVPRFAWQAGCGTRMTSVLDAEIDDTGAIHVLGNECSTGRVLLERWSKGETKSHVEVLSTVKPRPEGFEAVDIELGIFDGEAWVWGLEWFWGGGPVTQRLLTHRAGGTWPLEELPCDSLTVSAFSVWRGYQVAVCDKLLLRSPGADWSVAMPEASYGLQLFDGRLLLSNDEGLWQFDPPGVANDTPKLGFDLPCPGHHIDLGIGKDFARARHMLEPLGDLRKEMVLAASWDHDKIFLVAPDQQTAFAAANTLKLQSEPECMMADEFQTFARAD